MSGTGLDGTAGGAVAASVAVAASADVGAGVTVVDVAVAAADEVEAGVVGSAGEDVAAGFVAARRRTWLAPMLFLEFRKATRHLGTSASL